MYIEITVSGAGGASDVALTAPDETRMGAIAAALAAIAGGDDHASLWCGRVALDKESRLADTGLRRGAVVHLGEPSPAVPSIGPLLRVVGGARAGELIPLHRGTLTIGRARENAVMVDDDGASRLHAEFEVGNDEVVVRDLGSTNGTRIDGVTVDPEMRMRPGQLLRVADSLFTFGDPCAAPALRSKASDGLVVVHRAARRPEPRAAAVVELPGVRETSGPGRVQWLAALLPAVFGVGIAVAMDAPQFLLFVLLTPVMVLGGAAGDRVHWRRSRRRAAARARGGRVLSKAAIDTGLRSETARRRETAPDATVVQRIAVSADTRLWERRGGERDHLCARVGNADQPSYLQVRQGPLTTPAGTLADVPVCVDLRRGPLGVSGPTALRDGVGAWVISQLAVLQSPADVEIVLLLETDDTAWRWARWLPHLRAAAVGPEACADEVTRLADELARRARANSGSTAWQGSWVVVVAVATACSTHGLAALLTGGAGHGFSAVLLADATAPPGGAATIRADPGSGRATVTTAGFVGRAVVDRVSPAWSETVARALAPLIDAAAPTAGTPTSVGLVDVLATDTTTDAITDAWSTSDGGAAAPVGIGTDGPVWIDLVRDGPHALVAGTTGAGKSELLRTLVTALAARYPPDELNFVLVDYKGGAAFRDCERYPHTAALVTDLDTALTGRALRSLHAELSRREVVLAEADAADLAGYRARSGRGGMPRLVLVVDEFAELAAELPDFLAGLVGVARRGRSLGVHLVLATQRPGGVVSPEIRANTSIRVALRVTDPAESLDVIGTSDAALLDPRQPGRAWVRTASGSTLFQTALATKAAAPKDVVVEPLPRWRGSSGPDAGTEHGLALWATTMAGAGRPAARRPWCPPLPDRLTLTRPSAGQRLHVLEIGRVDRPDEQAQPPLTIDLDQDRSILIVGRSGTGRTTALVSVLLAAAGALDPSELEVYVIDAVGELATIARELPHSASVLGPAESPLATALLDRLVARAERAASPTRTIVLLDGWDRIVSGLDDRNAPDCTGVLDRLARLGTSNRLTVVATGDRGLLTTRFGTAAFGTRYALGLSDRADYSLLGVNSRDVPTSLPPGRAVRANDGALVQFALPATEGDPPTEAVAAVAARWSGVTLGRGAIRVRPLPRSVRPDEVAAPGRVLRLGLAGDAARPCLLDPVRRARLLVAGPPRSGRTSVLRTVLAEATRLGVPTVVACPERSPLYTDAGQYGATVVTPDTADGSVAPDALLLVDDVEEFAGTVSEDLLVACLRRSHGSAAAFVAGRNDELATSFRGPAFEVRRERCGILLHPTRLDADLLGFRPAMIADAADPPGRGVIVGDPRWGGVFTGSPVPIQVADVATELSGSCR